jgi:hypothetical protein
MSLAKLSQIDVRPHVRLIDGKLVKVKGHRRIADISQGDFSPAQLKTAADKDSQVHPNVNFEDQRKKGPPLRVDPDALHAAMEAAGVKITPDLKIRLRLRDQNSAGTDQGLTQRLGPNEFRVVVKVANKPQFKPHHLYILNNSLVHEFRHVRQEQDDPQFGQKYAQQNLTVGYGKNKYEIEAREYGRLADPTGERSYKGLPKGLKILGEAIWGLVPE